MEGKNLFSNSIEQALISKDPDENDEELVDMILLLDALASTVEELIK